MTDLPAQPHVKLAARFAPGDIYEDCSSHPCLCIGVSEEEDEIWGVSLIDGSYPRSCSLQHCSIEKLTVDQAWMRKKALQGLKTEI